MKQSSDPDIVKPVTRTAGAPPRPVVYSPETTAAYGAVIDAGMTGDVDQVLVALRHLMMMVHCDFTGELREAHTHGLPTLYCKGCGDGMEPDPIPSLCVGCVSEALARGVDPDPTELKMARLAQGPLFPEHR